MNGKLLVAPQKKVEHLQNEGTKKKFSTMTQEFIDSAKRLMGEGKVYDYPGMESLAIADIKNNEVHCPDETAVPIDVKVNKLNEQGMGIVIREDREIDFNTIFVLECVVAVPALDDDYKNSITLQCLNIQPDMDDALRNLIQQAKNIANR